MAVKTWVGTTTNPATAGNWSGGTVPEDGDSIVVPASATFGIAGADLTAGGTVQFVGLTVEEGCTVTLGSAATPLHIDLKDGASYYDANLAGSGVSYLQIDNAANINVTNAASAATGLFGLTITGVNDASAQGKLNIRCPSTAKIAVGTTVAGSCEANVITVSGGNVTLQSGLVKYDGSAAPDLTMSGGDVAVYCPTGTIAKTGGNMTTLGGAIAAYTGNGGNTYHKSTGTITAGTIGGNEAFDASLDLRAKTITSFTIQGSSATYKDPNKVITNTNPIQLKGGAKVSQLDIGTDCGIARSALA